MNRSKNFVFGALILLTLIVLVILPALWLGYGQMTNKATGEAVQSGLGTKILFTLVGLGLVIGGWWNYFRQRKIDSGQQPSKTGEKVMSTMYKTSGYYARVRAVIAWIISGVLFIVIIAVLFFGVGDCSSVTKAVECSMGARILFSVVMFALAIWAIIYGIIFWKRSKSLVKGRFY